jgi:hypothetical protein
MKTLLLILFCAFSWHKGSSQEVKPAYAGSVDYAAENFGTYDHPVKGDSVLVFIQGDKLNFILTSKTGKGALIIQRASPREEKRI